MKSGFPIPAIEYFPKNFKDDESMIALAAKIDSGLGGVQTDILGMRDWMNPESCPTCLLDELGYELAAGLLPTDSDATKRAKITTAVQTQKKRGTWQFSVKLIIDAIIVPLGSVGAVLWTDWDRSGAWLLRASLTTEPDNYMASMGTDGVDPYLGILLLGSGEEFEVAGNVYIDLQISTLTAEQVLQIVAAIQDEVVPPYFRVRLGYLVAGQFTTYAGGVIG